MSSIQLQTEDFINIINVKSNDELKVLIQQVRDKFRTQQFNTQELKQLIIVQQTQLTNWLKQNVQNPKSAFCYEYATTLYEIIGFEVLITNQTYYKGQEDEEKAKESESSQSEMKLQNPHLCLEMFLLGLSHLQTLVDSKKLNSGEEHTKLVLFQILRLLSVYAEEKEIQAQCRRQKLLKVFLKIFQDLFGSQKQQQQVTRLDIDISHMTVNLLTKITFKSKKNQDYVSKKKGYELIKGIMITSKDIPLYQSAVFFLANCGFSTDSRLLLWVAGVVDFLKSKMIENFDLIKQTSNPQELSLYLSQMESSLILLHRLCVDTKEICEQVIKDQQYMNILKAFTIQESLANVVQNPQKTAIYGTCIGIVRKISAYRDLRQQIINEFMQSPVDFLKTYYQDPNIEKNQVLAQYLFKEIMAILGVFAIEEESRQKILSSYPTIFNSVIKIGLKYLQDPKLVKTTVGCLTNFTVLPQIRESLSKDKDFYVLIYGVIENYDYSVSLLEYTLKMILNSSQNELCFQNYSAPKFVLKLIFLSFIYQTQHGIFVLLLKIFRVLAQNDLVLQTINKCAREYEVSNREFRFAQVLVEGMKTVLNPQPDMILDIILFVSMLMQQDREFIQEINDKTQFVPILKEFIDRNRNNQEMLEKISQCLAFLPLEDFKNMINL